MNIDDDTFVCEICEQTMSRDKQSEPEPAYCLDCMAELDEYRDECDPRRAGNRQDYMPSGS